MSKVKIWSDEKGLLFHDECFEPGESREGYTAADLNNLDDDAECASCGGEIFGDVGLEDDSDDDDDDDDEETAQQMTTNLARPRSTAGSNNLSVYRLQ